MKTEASSLMPKPNLTNSPMLINTLKSHRINSVQRIQLTSSLGVSCIVFCVIEPPDPPNTLIVFPCVGVEPYRVLSNVEPLEPICNENSVALELPDSEC